MTILCDPNQWQGTIPSTNLKDGARYALLINTEWYPHFLGAIVKTLVNDDCYWLGDDDDIYDVRNQILKMLSEVKMGSTVPLWTIYPNLAPAGVIPDGHVLCNGLTYTREEYPEAYDAGNTPYKDPASETFYVPNLTGRVLRGLETAYPIGTNAGSDTHNLTVGEMPEHTHSEGSAGSTIINGGLEAPANSAIPFPTVTGSTGGGQAHNNMQKFHSVRWRIVLK